MPVYEPKREDAGLPERPRYTITVRLPADAVRRIFERIIDEMRTLQKTRMQGLDARRDAGRRHRRADPERDRPAWSR